MAETVSEHLFMPSRNNPVRTPQHLRTCCCCAAASAAVVAMQARGQVPGKTGVWVGDRKIGAVGVRITHGITSHGIALNVVTDLDVYRHIVPCGTPDTEVTSIERELQRPLDWRLSSSNSSHGKQQMGQKQQQQQLGAQQVGVDLAIAEQHLFQAFLRVFRPSEVQEVTQQQLLDTADADP